MKNVLVTGASGHLGRNLVNNLIATGTYKVKAVIRDKDKAEKLKLYDSGAEVIIANLSNLDDITMAMRDVHIVFQVAANFSHWSKNPQKDIIDENNTICTNVLKAAKTCGVEKIIFVSSIGALKRNSDRKIEPEDWIENTHGNPYFESKLQSEKLAWKKSEELNLNMVSVLPAAMIGGSFIHSTPTSQFLNSLKNGEIPFDLNFEMNLVDINLVCEAMINAIEGGKPGQRYILANPSGISMMDINDFYRSRFPKLKRPLKVTKSFLIAVATIAEWIGYIRGKEPVLLKSQVKFYYNKKENFEISKSINDLGFSLKTNIQCLSDELLSINN